MTNDDEICFGFQIEIFSFLNNKLIFRQTHIAAACDDINLYVVQ